MFNTARFIILVFACCLFSLACTSKERGDPENAPGETAKPTPGALLTEGEEGSSVPGRRKERPAGLESHPDERYYFLDPDGDGDVSLTGRVPVESGQELYFEYFAPFWEKREPLTLIDIGGFDLLSGGRTYEPIGVSVIRNQSFHEMIRVLLKLDYEGEFEGRVELIVYFNDGTGTVVSLGPSGRAFYRTGIVSVEAGVHLRVQPDIRAKSLKVLEKGTKVFFTGKIDFIQPSADATLGEAIVFREVVVEGNKGWAAVGTFGGDDYITPGEFEVY